MAKVTDLLRLKKHREVITTTSQNSVFDAIKLMSQQEIGSLLVIDDGVLLGMITERDYARKIILEGKSSKQVQVAAIMRKNIRCISPETSIDLCRKIMTDEFIRYLPVVQDERLIGLVSLGDIVAFMIDEKNFLIDQLTNYITGSHGQIHYNGGVSRS